jgi:hypothetical protein
MKINPENRIKPEKTSAILSGVGGIRLNKRSGIKRGKTFQVCNLMRMKGAFYVSIKGGI